MNLDRWGGWGAHWDICHDHQQSMQAGSRGKAGRAFGLNAMRYVAAVSVRDGDAEAIAGLDPRALAPRWDDVAFLEAIKCAPHRPRSESYPEMFAACPATYLAEELEILCPAQVLVLGRSRLRDVVRPLFQRRFALSWGTHTRGLEADRMVVADQPVAVYCLNHPSARPAAVRSSLESLCSAASDAPTALVNRSTLGPPPTKEGATQ